MPRGFPTLTIILFGVVAGLYVAADIPLATNIDASVPPENIVSDAIAYNGVSRGADVDVDVSDIVKKYIVVGDSREEVTRYLTALGFEMFFNPQQVDGKDVLIATRYPMQRFLGQYYVPIVFSDALRVFVHFDGQAVASAAGRITYKAL